MQSEEERKIHPPGHENHGVHVCRKCGWSFPNPHPSAKHRRAHKKVCGKMEGFKVMSSESKTHLAVSDDELSDEDHNPEGLKNQHSGLDEKSSGGIEPVVGVSQPVEDVFSDAVSEFPDSGSGPDKDLLQISEDQASDCASEAPAGSNTPKPTDLIRGDQIQAHDALKSEAVQMQSDFHDHALCSSTDVMSSSILDNSIETLDVDPTEDKNNGTSPVAPETPIDDSVGNTKANACENVIDSVDAAEGNEKGSEDENLPAIVLPSITVSDTPQIKSTLDNMEEFSDAELPSELTNSSAVKMTKDSSKDIVCVQKQQDNALGQQNSQNEPSATAHLRSMEAEGHEYLGALVDTGNIQNPSDSAKDCHVDVHGHGDENLPNFSMLADVTVGNISDIKSEVELQDDSTITCQGPDEQTEALGLQTPHNELISSTCSGSMSVKPGKSVDEFASTTQVEEDNLQVDVSGSKSMPKELIVDQSGTHGDRNEERVLYIEGAVENLRSEGVDARSEVTNGEPLVTKAFAPNEAVMGSIGINATVSHSEEKKTEFSFGEHGYQIDLSHEIPQQSLIVAADEATMESRGYDVVHKETRINIVGEYSQEGATDENSLSGAKINPESASGVAETKPQFHVDIGRDEVERNLQPTEIILEPNSDKSSEEIAFRSFSDPSVMETEGQVAGIEMDSRLPKPHLEEPIPNESSEIISALDTGCVQSSFTPDNCNAEGFSEGVGSENYSHSLGEEGGDISKQNVKASDFSMETSVDSISQSDSVEGYWGSVSDGTAPSTRDVTNTPPILTTETLPTINVQTSTEASNANTKKGNTDNADLFEAPSFMTVSEPRRADNRQPNSTEIQSLQNPQHPNSPSTQATWFPSPTNVVNESEGRKKKEEIIAKVVNWSSGKPHTPLKNLLVEANLDRKQKFLTVPDHTPTTQTTHKYQTSQDVDPTVKIAPEFSAAPDIKRAADEEWNSPAKLPVSKTGKRKVKAYWVPFVCCSSVN